MACSCCNPVPVTAISLGLLLLASVSPVLTESMENNTFRPREELLKSRRMRALLKRLNKPSVKTIQSPDGDIIDCVPSHLQPAFDHPRLKGLEPMDPPERPQSHRFPDPMVDESFQLWRISGESCPDGTIPVRRTKEEDVLRASSVKRFGRKLAARLRRDSESSSHEHAVGYVVGDQYYGAKASLNVWAPRVTSPTEFSLSQIWVISGSFGHDLNTIEAGWQVSPQLYGDNAPRFFTYWTMDAYQATGCYNLLCSGFIQTNNRIAIGAAISPTSTYNGGQFDISLLVWKLYSIHGTVKQVGGSHMFLRQTHRSAHIEELNHCYSEIPSPPALEDPNHGNWWLEFGSGLLVGYWPSFLFSHLAEHASMVQFGGEIVNTQPSGSHTSTQMGSGYFAHEGFGKASYFRNLQVVDGDNSLIPVQDLRVLADHPDCYDIQGGINSVWGNYFYYGGPGRNVRCQ